MDSCPVLKVNNLSKIYKKRKAVDSLSFEVNAGEIVGFLGPNGSGKSTTIKMITGIIKPTNGEIVICGANLKQNYEKAISNVGALIESPNMYDYMTGLKNLKVLNNLTKKNIRRKIYEVAELVGLQNRLKDKVSKYSLGMKQRLGIAQALLSDPKLLVLDEPTNGLDANGIKEMRMFLKRIAREKKVAILISSHILSEMENLCDKVVIINNGSLVEIKDIKEIKNTATSNGSHYIKVNAPNYAGKLIMNYFNINVKLLETKVFFDANDEILAKIIILLTQNKIAVYAAGKVDLTLEDVFIKATNAEIN